MYLAAAITWDSWEKWKALGGGALWAHGTAAAAHADSPRSVAPIVIRSIVQRVKKTALFLPVLLVPA